MAQSRMIPAGASKGAYQSVADLAVALCFKTGKMIVLPNMDDKVMIRKEIGEAISELNNPKDRQEFLGELDRLLRE